MSLLAQKSEFETHNPRAVDRTSLLFYIRFSGMSVARRALCHGVPWCPLATRGALRPVISVSQEMSTQFSSRIFLHEQEIIGRKSQLAKPFTLPVAAPTGIIRIYFLRFVFYLAQTP